MKVWKKYPNLTKAILKTHNSEGGNFFAHDFDHIIRVTSYAQEIAEDGEVGNLAGVAALCHNADRILQKRLGIGRNDSVQNDEVIKLVNEWLAHEPEAFTAEEKYLIVDAILNHNQKNNENDSPVLMTIMDADRIVNTEIDAIIRHSQYYPNLQVIDPVHLLDTPEESFRNPKSVLGNLMLGRRDWLTSPLVGVRLPKAKKIMEQKLEALEQFATAVIKEREEAGLIPYPTFE